MGLAVRFNGFEFDLQVRELRRRGIRLRVPDQSLQIFAMLLERPGEVVSRDAIRDRLWPHGTIVEFEHSVNSAVQRLREALSDSAASPRYVETLAKRGYRFIGQIEAPVCITHYRILDEIGRGEMGVVYRAEDLKLGRQVAVKLLPPELASDPGRKARLIREARAASALNHPNIVTVHDVGRQGGLDFIVMELVDGKPLSELINPARMPLERVLDIEVQIADALAAAHSAGIVHRDLKPGNIMVTGEGRVKLLDFGVAKFIRPAGPETQTQTSEGAVLGTVAYMSPEQAQGLPVDARSDLFSFGAVMYEMITGRRAFRGHAGLSTLAALLEKDPDPLSESGAAVPEKLERLILRCLRKDVKLRSQSAAEVKAALVEVREELKTRPPAQSATPRSIWPLIAIASLAIAALAAWAYLRRGDAQEPRLTVVPLTTYRGNEDAPTFSPDGSEVAFQWRPEGTGQNCHIYIKQIGVEREPFQLTSAQANDVSPAWSPDGRFIAFLRDRSEVLVVSQRGGPERLLRKVNFRPVGTLTGPYLAWSPDSKWIAFPDGDGTRTSLLMISFETADVRKLADAPPDSEYTTPAFSPDGRAFAFTEQNTEGGGRLNLLHLGDGYAPQGKPGRIGPPDNTSCCGLAWTADGRGLVFSSSFFAHRGLWRVSMAAPYSPARIAIPSEFAYSPAVSRTRNRLAYTAERTDLNIWRASLERPGGRPGIPLQFVASTQLDYRPEYSPDGKQVAFVSDRSGTDQIWICDSEGGHAAQISTLQREIEPMGLSWSPDGQQLAFSAIGNGESGIFAMGPAGGPAKRMADRTGQWPSWSRDGRWLYFAHGSGSTTQVWKVPAQGGKAVQVTHVGGDADIPQESPDGKFLYYHRGWPGPRTVWRLPVEGGEEVKVLDGVSWWRLSAKGVYYVRPAREESRCTLFLYNLATHTSASIFTTAGALSGTFTVSPDERSVLYTQVDEVGSDLMLVENFK